jgi:pilus assembly protein FimV
MLECAPELVFGPPELLRSDLICMKNCPFAPTVCCGFFARTACAEVPVRRSFLPATARLMLWLILTLSGAAVQALELGRPQTLSALGQPLLLKIPVRLDLGETLRPDCIQVAVQAGERDVLPTRVTKTVEWQADQRSATIWVRTEELIDEPVVKLSLGCPRQQLFALIDQDAVADRGETQWLSAPPQVSSAARPASLLKAGPAGPAEAAAQPAKTVKADRSPQAYGLQITLPDTELAGARWRLDLETGPSAGSRRQAVAGIKETTYEPPNVSLLMAIDVDQPAAGAESAALDSERLQRAQLQFAALQRQQQAFNTEVDQLLVVSAQQQAEHSTLLRVVLGVAVAFALLALGWLLRVRLIGRQHVVPPA